MPRPHRLQDAGYLHHIICRGNDRQDLFSSKNDYLAYIGLIKEVRLLYPVKIYNYVLMRNHVHLLLEPRAEGAMSLFMEKVTKEYAKNFNFVYNRVGHVFQGRFKSFLIQDDKYFFMCSRYIDLNPSKGGFVSDPKDYPWSGHGKLAYGVDGPLVVDLHDSYMSLGKTDTLRQVAYRALVLNYMGEDLDLLNKRQGILGDSDFKRKVRSA